MIGMQPHCSHLVMGMILNEISAYVKLCCTQSLSSHILTQLLILINIELATSLCCDYQDIFILSENGLHIRTLSTDKKFNWYATFPAKSQMRQFQNVRVSLTFPNLYFSLPRQQPFKKFTSVLISQLNKQFILGTRSLISTKPQSCSVSQEKSFIRIWMHPPMPFPNGCSQTHF